MPITITIKNIKIPRNECTKLKGKKKKNQKNRTLLKDIKDLNKMEKAYKAPRSKD